MASPPTLDQLYESAQKLSQIPKDQMAKHVDDYRVILMGVTGDSPAKRLSSQFIARFFSNFTSLAVESLEAMIDLCEDPDVNIRKQAIKDLPLLCRENKDFLPRIADLLTQLLNTQDSSEIAVVQNSLVSLFKKDAKGSLLGLFSQVKTGGDEIRDRAIKFLHLKMKTAGPDLIPNDAHGILFEQISDVIEECSPDEFHIFMAILSLSKIPKLITGQSRVVDLIIKTAQIDKNAFDPTSDEDVYKLIQCTQAALPYLSSQVQSSRFCEHFCINVFPSFDLIESEDAKAQILKLLAELCLVTGDVKETSESAKNVLDKLMDHLPPSPEAVESDTEGLASTKFEFTKVECLLFAFHAMAAQDPNFITTRANEFKELKTRLQFFGLAVKGYTKKLQEFIASIPKSDLSKEENQLKTVALRSALNISNLIKSLLRNPPIFSKSISLSWKGDQPKVVVAPKRPLITHKESGSAAATQVPQKQIKRVGMVAREVYAPPTGKFSSSMTSKIDFDSPGAGRRGGGFRGNRRPYRGGRGRYNPNRF